MTRGATAAIIALVNGALLVAVLTGSSLLAVGCAGEGSDLCSSLEDLQGSIQDIRNLELRETSAEDLRQELDELNADVDAVGTAGGEEIQPELDQFQTSVRTLVDEVEAAAAEGDITSEEIAALADPVSAAASAFQALGAAAPDCDLAGR
jgi:flagellar motor component MotA